MTNPEVKSKQTNLISQMHTRDIRSSDFCYSRKRIPRMCRTKYCIVPQTLSVSVKPAPSRYTISKVTINRLTTDLYLFSSTADSYFCPMDILQSMWCRLSFQMILEHVRGKVGVEPRNHVRVRREKQEVQHLLRVENFGEGSRYRIDCID